MWNINRIKVFFILFSCSLCVNSVMSLWEFALTTKNKIIFYDDKWSTITTAAHQFDELSAISFDETEERIYFNDQSHNDGSIFSLKLTVNEDENHVIEKVLARTHNETIAGITFDPLDRMLYWTDSENKKIIRMLVTNDDQIEEPEVFLDFSNEDVIPDGIAIDICRRKLYWTNSNHKNPSIERSSLNGTKREIIINTNLFLPHGIVVDQYSQRIYWVVDQEGSHFTVEGANLDGTEQQVIVEGLNNIPFNIAVTKNSIFWTDLIHNAVWSIGKTPKINERPTKVKSFPSNPKGILARTNILSRTENNVDCKDVVKQIKAKMLLSKQTANELDKKINNRQIEIFCLNNGEYSPHSGACICKTGFTGTRCEVSECHNFCVHGTCTMSTMGFPECTCQEGAFGERCETHKCSDYCLNDGHCEIINGNPQCQCLDLHLGARCEGNTTAICALLCQYGKYDSEWTLPSFCTETCEENQLVKNDFNYHIKMHNKSSYKMCNDTYNKTVIFVVIGILTSLIVVFAIIYSIRKIYKPARPRIKKTFVVQKKTSQTPLTSRPISTEQCEITIENCCNMNICDTPCFDPKLLQQNLLREDKKILINNMEEDLY